MFKLSSSTLLLATAIFLSACGGAGGPKIVIPSYTAPKEASKLSKIETKDEYISDGAYLALWINPNVSEAQNTNAQLQSLLIDSVKSKLTQTNFIAIDPMGGEEGVALNMKVSNYSYEKVGTKVSLALEVTFTLSRGMDEFLVKKYSDRKNRQSRDASKLPTENELASQSVSKVVKYFISDISPLKTNQLREFKSLPSELQPVVSYAKRKNYKGAIKLMQRHKDGRDMNYYYNLAILFEAEASIKEDLSILRFAKLNYQKAMDQGGFSDKLVSGAKARFDNFYELLNQTKKQSKANQALINDRNSMGGSADDEYE